jgi:hypothetical protein
LATELDRNKSQLLPFDAKKFLLCASSVQRSFLYQQGKFKCCNFWIAKGSILEQNISRSLLGNAVLFS